MATTASEDSLSRPIALSEGNGDHPDGCGEGSHQDRPGPDTNAVPEGIHRGGALFPCNLYEVDEQDGILHHDSRQEDDAHEGCLRELFVRQKQGPECTDQRQGNGRHDRQRMDEGVEGRHEGKIEKHHGDHEGRHQGGEGLFGLLGVAFLGDPVSGRQLMPFNAFSTLAMMWETAAFSR